MSPHHSIPLAVLLFGSIIPSLASAQAGLSAEERETATSIAEGLLSRAGPLAQRRIYPVRAELFREKAAEEAGVEARQALVTHYQYQGDLAILTFVNLRDRRVIRQDTIAHLPVPLSPAEFEQARELALMDSAVARELAPYRDRLVVEPLVLRTSDPNDPLAGQRVVRLLFRVGPDYLRRPIVTVNLSTREVLIEDQPR